MKTFNSLELLWPPFAVLIAELMGAMNRENYTMVVLESYRSPVRQNALFSKGRIRPGKVITNSRGWQSWHQYGLAVDLIFDSHPEHAGIQGPYSGDFDLLGEIAIDLGLGWGGRWGDKGHIQAETGMRVSEARLLQSRDGVLGLWAELDRLQRTK